MKDSMMNQTKFVLLFSAFVIGAELNAQTLSVERQGDEISLIEQNLQPFHNIRQEFVFVSNYGEIVKIISVGDRFRNLEIFLNDLKITLPSQFQIISDQVILSTVNVYTNETSGCINIIFDIIMMNDVKEGTMAICEMSEDSFEAVVMIDGEVQ